MTDLLKTIMRGTPAVECKTDDFLERARDMSADEFSREFEKKVGGLGGFSAPFWPPLKRALMALFEREKRVR